MSNPPAPPLRLIGPDGRPRAALGPDLLIVGRHPHCDVRLDSLRVSRRHCCLAEVDGVVLVRDLGSTNGTRINGRRVLFGRLRPGDDLAIAHLHFRVVGESSRESRAGG